MPSAPLPPELDAFVRSPRPAIVGTQRPDGAPVTAATWFGWEGDLLLLSMNTAERRYRNIQHEPRIALTVLGDNWYDHVSLRATVVTIREDPDLVDLDELSQRYLGKPRERRTMRVVTALAEVTHWHTWGRPGVS